MKLKTKLIQNVWRQKWCILGDVQMANELLCISELNIRRGGGEETPLFGLNGYVSLNRVYSFQGAESLENQIS